MGLKKAGMPPHDGESCWRPSAPTSRHGGRLAVQRAMLDAAPRIPAGAPAGSPARCRRSGGVDGADRGADDPVGLDAGFVQRLVDAGLVGAQRAAALQHQHDLAEGRPARRLPASLRSVTWPVLGRGRLRLAARSMGGPAAIDRDGGAGDRCGRVAGQEHCDARPISSTLANRLFGCARAARRGSPLRGRCRGRLAWSSICASTSGVRT